MPDCKNLIHPFQHDPGTSQRQRILDDLLNGESKIDGRSTIDLLDYFVQLSRHINYFDKDLSVSDWQPFFKKSIPFSLARMAKFNRGIVEDKVALYSKLFERNPSSAGLQLLVHYIYYSVIDSINNWHVQLKGTDLPVELALGKLISDKLGGSNGPMKKFIKYTNEAVKNYSIKPLNLSKIENNEIWDLSIADINEPDNNYNGNANAKRKRLLALYKLIAGLLPSFLELIRSVGTMAELSIERSFLPLKEELKEKHTPHLAIVFAFLKLFKYLQNDLNEFSKKHLDFFYRKVLLLKPKNAVADKIHVVFEIQKLLKKFKLDKGISLKDGKDDKKADIFFDTDDEIVINKAQVADTRTLFLNNQNIYNYTYIEGVYMAQDATKADGIAIDFPEEEIKSFPTLGAHNSKYSDPENHFVKPYPNARLGLILASPTLLLKEGKRTITIELACKLKKNICGEIKDILEIKSNPCCTDNDKGQEIAYTSAYPDFFSAVNLFNDVRDSLNNIYYYINKDIIEAAAKRGIGKDIIDSLYSFLKTETKHCYCPVSELKFEVTKPAVEAGAGFEEVFDEDQRKILYEFFPPRKILDVQYSGEKGWLKSSIPDTFHFLHIDTSSTQVDFVLQITSTFEADKPAITFYNKDALGEDIGTTQPVVKIEVDDKIKLEENLTYDTNAERFNCCLERDVHTNKFQVSFYHFFKNIIIEENETSSPPKKTTISVKVCEMKNFIVQNDESVMNVNGTIHAFGASPTIGSNLYIGSEEIFLKKWSDIKVNLNWQDFPAPPASAGMRPFEWYYNGYQTALNNSPATTSPDKVLDENFRMSLAILQDGKWHPWNHDEKCGVSPAPANTLLFQPNVADGFCNNSLYDYQFKINRRTDFNPTSTGLELPAEALQYKDLKRLDVSTRHSFMRITLKCQDFQHAKYPFVLARQMTAMGKLPNVVDDAVYYGFSAGTPPYFSTINIREILQGIVDSYELSVNPNADLVANIKAIINQIDVSGTVVVDSTLWKGLFDKINPLTGSAPAPSFGSRPVGAFFIPSEDFSDYYAHLKSIIKWLGDKAAEIKNFANKGVVIPKTPWPAIIKNISLNYKAVASIDDIDLIHLYPYKGTYKPEDITNTPTLIPTFCNEGTLFVGLKDLVPGDNLNILFQMAEATADSESIKESVNWYYLENNQWKLLRNGFDILEDETQGLTGTGIIKFALPANMTTNNTILPNGLHWIKAAIPKNSRSVCETIGIHTQAIKAVFTNAEENDKLRLSKALPAGSVSKLKVADSSVKKISQPYDSFGGRVPEMEGHFYVRVSELLRHKNRAIQKFDYERITLEAFPQLFKVKCINHSFALDAKRYFNDFPMAPGYVLIAVIPDLNQLKAAESFEPRVPVSILDDIKNWLHKRTSPFVRLFVKNPRYEKVNFCLKVKLVKGKDENYYKEKLRQDLREFMAPWAVGSYDKFDFGQCIYRSDIVRFLESRDYIDYLIELRMNHEENGIHANNSGVCPLTPRSILIAGSVDICIPPDDCNEKWQKCYDQQNNEIACCNNETVIITDHCKK